MKDKKYVKSPFNYTGGKIDLLPQMEKFFPKNIDTFVDVFGGGATVIANVDFNKGIYNEKQSEVYDFFKNFYKCDINYLIEKMNEIVNNFNELKTKEDFLNLRADYNKNKYWLSLLVLSFFSFNYSLRFNSKGEFNNSSGIGNCKFPNDIFERIENFGNNLKEKNIFFYNNDFEDLDLDFLGKDDFVYLDPPYFLSIAHYNKGWTLDKEQKLLDYIDNLNKRDIRFALSNVIYHKGLNHPLLEEWISKNNYNIYILDKSYNYSWASNKKEENKKNNTVEVLITNYEFKS